MVTAHGCESVGGEKLGMETAQRWPLVVIGADVQDLRAASLRVALEPEKTECGQPLLSLRRGQCIVAISAVAQSGWAIIIVQSHADLSRVRKTAGSSADHRPSSGATVCTLPSAAFAAARTA